MDRPLMDRFGRDHTYLRVSVTDRCNLRCSYCMPEEGIAWTPPAKVLSKDEIVRLAALFVSMGITKIRLTGGEPLLRADILPIVRSLSLIEGLQTLAMTTNGLGLTRDAILLRSAGLTTLTISLDTLRQDRFLRIAKRDRLHDVLNGIDAALAAGFAPVKINIVVMNGVNDDEIVDFVQWGKDLPLDLRFIEYMPFPDNHWSEGGLLPYAEMKRRLASEFTLIPRLSEPSAVGKTFTLQGHVGTVSFITSMTESFCGSCNRLRLTADGNVKSCLFHPAEKSLRDIMREGGDDVEIATVIKAALLDKPAAHLPADQLQTVDNRAMIAIGG